MMSIRASGSAAGPRGIHIFQDQAACEDWFEILPFPFQHLEADKRGTQIARRTNNVVYLGAAFATPFCLWQPANGGNGDHES